LRQTARSSSVLALAALMVTAGALVAVASRSCGGSLAAGRAVTSAHEPLRVDSVTVVDRCTLDVRIQSGLPPCDHTDIAVAQSHGEQEVTISVSGRPRAAPGTICLLMGVVHTARVKLVEPLEGRAIVDQGGRPLVAS
jgi:hypothetical protein